MQADSSVSSEAALDASIAEAGGFGPDLPEPAEAAAAAPVAAPAAPAPVDEDDFDAIPSHEELVNGVKRINRIPHDRVQKIIEKQRAKAVEETLANLRETLGLPADAPLTLDDAKRHVSERGTKLSEYERELEGVRMFQQAMEHPEHMLALLARVNPAYQRYVQPPAPATPPPAEINLDDYSMDLGNGNRTFSFDGLKKYIDHVVRSARSEVPPQLQPLLARAQQEEALERRRKEVAPLVQMAQQFPGFKQHEAEILKLIQEDKTITLPQAYERVVWAKQQADAAKIREQVMQELKAAPPASTSTASTPAAPAKAPSVDDVIADSIAKAMERGAA